MPRSTGAQVLGFLGFVVLAGTSAMIYSAFGQQEGLRFWGICLVLTSIVFTFMKRIPVSVGRKALRPLEGWRKAYVLVPCYAIGLAVTSFPHEVACAVNLRGYGCG